MPATPPPPLTYSLYGDGGVILPDRVPLAELPGAILAAAADMGHPDDKLAIEPDKPAGTPRLDLGIVAVATDWGYDHAYSLLIEPIGHGPLADHDWPAWWPRGDGLPGGSPIVGEWDALAPWLAAGLARYDAACRAILHPTDPEETR